MISEANLLLQPQYSVVSLKDQKRLWKNGKSPSYHTLCLLFDGHVCFVISLNGILCVTRLVLVVCRGFTDSHTALLMLKRAQKMKSTTQRQKKRRGECVQNRLLQIYACQLLVYQVRLAKVQVKFIVLLKLQQRGVDTTVWSF